MPYLRLLVGISFWVFRVPFLACDIKLLGSNNGFPTTSSTYWHEYGRSHDRQAKHNDRARLQNQKDLGVFRHRDQDLESRSRSHMLKYRCLICGIEWGDAEATEYDISHGYCPACIRKRYTEKIHRSQLRDGFSDCFNRGHNDCSEANCCFRSACQEDSMAVWEKRLLEPVDLAEIDANGQ
jgi:hypothetical protein